MWLFFLVAPLSAWVFVRLLLKVLSEISSTRDSRKSLGGLAEELVRVLVIKFTLVCLTLFFAVCPPILKRRLRPAVPDLPTPSPGVEKTVVFVRHAESTWNVAFNRGYDLWMPLRLLFFGLWALVKLLDRDSVLFDAPVSELGLSQALDLMKRLEQLPEDEATEKGELFRLIQGTAAGSNQNVVLVSSPLRRALTTGLVALSKHIDQHPDKVVQIVASLQEFTKNPDSIALPWQGGSPLLPELEDSFAGLPMRRLYSESVARNRASEPKRIRIVERLLADVRQCWWENLWMLSSLEHRHADFSDFVVNRTEAHTVIVVGHSLWFREFFRRFGEDLDFGRFKVTNCGVVKFRLRANSVRRFFADFLAERCFDRFLKHGTAARRLGPKNQKIMSSLAVAGRAARGIAMPDFCVGVSPDR